MRLLESSASNVELANYDTDRNSDPGLTLVRSADTVQSTDPTAVQIWRTGPSFRDTNDTIVLQLWFTSATDPGGAPIAVEVALFDCANNGTDCLELVRQADSFTAPATGFVPRSFDLSVPGGAYTPGSGRGIELRVAVPLSSATDLWVAYDSDNYPAAITL